MARKEGLIGRKVGMTQVFGGRRQPRPGDGRSRPGPARSSGIRTQGAARLRRAPARASSAKKKNVTQAGGRASSRRPTWPRCGVLREIRLEKTERLAGLRGRPGAHRRDVRARRAGRRGRRHQGQGLPGRRQAPRLVRRRRHPRLDVPPRARARSAPRPIPRACGRATSCPGGWAAMRRTVLNVQRGARDARAEPRCSSRRGARRQRLAGDRPQVREDDQGAAAEGGGQEIAMPTVRSWTRKGKQAGTLELRPEVFGVEVSEPLLHQAVVRELADRRAGTHDTKGRSEVSGGGRKPWKQKGTGRARQGSIRATQWKGGGKPFGPTPRSYDKAMPRADAPRGAARGGGRRRSRGETLRGRRERSSAGRQDQGAGAALAAARGRGRSPRCSSSPRWASRCSGPRATCRG